MNGWKRVDVDVDVNTIDWSTLLSSFLLHHLRQIFTAEQAQQIATMHEKTQLACDKPAQLTYFLGMCVPMFFLLFYSFPLKSHHFFPSFRNVIFWLCSGDIMRFLKSHEGKFGTNWDLGVQNDKIKRQRFLCNPDYEQKRIKLIHYFILWAIFILGIAITFSIFLWNWLSSLLFSLFFCKRNRNEEWKSEIWIIWCICALYLCQKKFLHHVSHRTIGSERRRKNVPSCYACVLWIWI